MKFLNGRIPIIAITVLLIISSCQNEKYNRNSKLDDLDLLRGDIALCGDPEFGEISFGISCKNSSRATFNLAVSLLHSFEYNEAEKLFVKIIDADPDCTMAYWGVAMSLYHALWFAPTESELAKGAKLLEIAEDLPKTAREEEYLDAIGAYYKQWDKLDPKTRAKKVEVKMGEIYEKYPDDTEAAIFYALALNSTADKADQTYANQRKAGGILESIFPDQPDHPGIAHYIIHNYDNPELAHLALPTARRYAEIAPASAHAQHMPSHIFTRLGLWDESISSNLNSAESAVCYAEAIDMQGHWDQEIHAIDYLVYAYLQQGDNAKALEQYEYLNNMEKVASVSTIAAYPLIAIPARLALENKRWSDAANLQLTSHEFPWEGHDWEMAMLHFSRALGASHTGDLDLARAEIALLESSQKKLTTAGDKYSANQVMIQTKAAQAWLYFAEGNNEAAIALMEEASKMESATAKHPVTPGEVLPASELLGDMYLAMRKPAQALEAYQLNLRDHPNRFNGIYGAAVASKMLEDREGAVLYYQKLINLTKSADSDRSEVLEAKKFVG